jgi:hypothetical protein
VSNALLIAYLDQNKWIELARAAKHPEQHPDARALLETLCETVAAGRLVLPLTASNIYETHKIADLGRRHDLAYVQSVLSRGFVFRGRHRRLEVEIARLVKAVYGVPAAEPSGQWFLSDIFFEAFAERTDKRLGVEISDRVLSAIRGQPSEALYNYLAATPEGTRTASVKNFSDGSDQLRLRIEERRKQHANESQSMRRKIHSALLMINEIDLIIELAIRAGASWKTVSDIGSAVARRLIEDVPTYYVEREIALRLEAQSRPIEENDFRDMQSFCAVVPYADAIVAENMFVSLARQAKLDRKYHTRLYTSIFDLPETLASG